jgi:regulator of nucleoside diphosphate kinase
MTKSTRTGRPPVHLISTEADNLTNLALGVAETMPQVSELLLREIARATIHGPAHIPSGIVTMHSTVQFKDEASGAERTVRLVYPAEADISAGRISILTPVGAGLLGLREGHSIKWPDREGRERRLTILKVIQPDRGL